MTSGQPVYGPTLLKQVESSLLCTCGYRAPDKGWGGGGGLRVI